MRPILIAAIVATATTTAAPALAAGDDESWEMWEQRQVMLAEIERAKRLGGYSDPLTAARNVANGTATEADIAPAYSGLEDIPGGPADNSDRTRQ